MVNINIPLPASCASCPLSVRHFGKLYCPPLNDRVGNEGKDSRCPLVDAGDQFAEVSKEVEAQMSLADCISRQDALSCFHDWIDQRGDVHTADEMPEYQRIEQLPSVQPEPSEIARDIATILVNEMDMRVIAKNAVQPEKGKWLDNETSYADGVRQTCTCSVCGLRSVRPLGNFCRWCGADMRGEQE